MKCTECSRAVKPVVAVDIDGTLGDYHSHLLSFTEGYFGRHLPWHWDGSGNWEDFLGLTNAEYREAKLAFRQGGQKRTMPLFPGARELTTALSEAGAEVWITTTRPWMRHDATDPDTREWLRRNGIKYDHLLYDDEKYRQLANIVDRNRVVAVIDDLPEQIREANKMFPGRAIMVRREHNAYALMPSSSLPMAKAIVLTRLEGWS